MKFEFKNLFISKSFYTHNGTFHADDVMSAALFLLMGGRPEKIYRVNRDEAKSRAESALRVGSNSIIADCGGIHSPEKGLFDHHQGGCTKSSCGLMFEAIGGNFPMIGYDEVKILIDKIDALDERTNPDNKAAHSQLKEADEQQLLPLLHLINNSNCADVNDEAEQLLRFINLAEVMVWQIEAIITRAETKAKEIEIFENRIECGHYIILEGYVGDWRERVSENITHAILPYNAGGWQVGNISRQIKPTFFTTKEEAITSIS